MMTDDEIRELVRCILEEQEARDRGIVHVPDSTVESFVPTVREWQARKEAERWEKVKAQVGAAGDALGKIQMDTWEYSPGQVVNMSEYEVAKQQAEAWKAEPERPKTDLMDEQERAAMVRASLAQDQFAVAGATWAKHRDEIVLKAWTEDSQT